MNVSKIIHHSKKVICLKYFLFNSLRLIKSFLISTFNAILLPEPKFSKIVCPIFFHAQKTVTLIAVNYINDIKINYN